MSKQFSTNLTMEELLASQTKKVITLTRNQHLEGEIVAKSDKELVLDLGAKSEGILAKRDFSQEEFDNFKVGDKIKAYVSQVENESGQTLLSTSPSMKSFQVQGSRFRGGRADWGSFINAQKQSSKLRGRVLEINRGGLIIEVMGVRGFLPNSQVGFELLSKSKRGLSDLVGEDLNVTVAEVDQNQNRLIFSQRGQVSKKVLEALKGYSVGQKVNGKIVAVLPFGLVVSVKDQSTSGGDGLGIEGLVFVSDVSWEKVEDLNSRFKIGQEVEVSVLGADLTLGRLNLSIKQLTEDPFAKLKEKYQPDDVVKGEVLEVSDGGVKIKLADGVEGAILPNKMGTAVYEVGKTVTVLVDNVDSRKRVINLAPMITSTSDLIYK